jgi:hypothetical protein
MKTYEKRDFPTVIILFLPGHDELTSTIGPGSRNRRASLTVGWHVILEFEPSLFGCYIWYANHSFEMVRKSKVCVL